MEGALTLKQVYEKAGEKQVALVHDPVAQIYYMVLNRPMNMIDFEFMEKVNDIIKEVSET